MPNVSAATHAQAARSVEAIRVASQNSGVDFSYLLQQARLESGLNPDAAAPTSSATGLFQFINQSWLATVRRHGAENGLGWAAAAIRRGDNGRLHVDDPALRRQILDLRRNPEAASAMAAAFASDNRAVLQRHVARPIENVDLYLAHFLGPGGATRFLTQHAANPDASAAELFPAAARANRSVFYDRGRPRSLDEVRERFSRRMGAAAEQPVPSGSNMLSPPNATTIASATPQQAQRASILARLAYATLAELGG